MFRPGELTRCIYLPTRVIVQENLKILNQNLGLFDTFVSYFIVAIIRARTFISVYLFIGTVNNFD